MSLPYRLSLLPLLTGCLALGLLAGCSPQQETSPTGPGAANLPGTTTTTTPEAGGEARDIQMTAADMRYDPSEITVQPGQQLRVTLTNEGEAPHNIEFELPSGEKEFEENLAPSETKTLEFQAPQEPGRYTFYCPVGDHREKGMTGTLIVAEGAGS